MLLSQAAEKNGMKTISARQEALPPTARKKNFVIRKSALLSSRNWEGEASAEPYHGLTKRFVLPKILSLR